MTTERIDIVISERGGGRVVDQFTRIARSSLRLEGGLLGLRSILVGLGSIAVIRSLTDVADAYTTIQNRLGVATTSSEELLAVQQELFALSNQSRTSVRASAEVYTRLAVSTTQLGISQQDVLDITRALNQATILSGATAKEATAGLIQLSQAFASGQLRGEELRSVMEQLPKVAQVLADSLGVTRGQLRALGEAGLLTSDLLAKALLEGAEELGREFANTIPTISQSLSVLSNSFLEFFGQAGQTSGVADAISRSIIFLSQNFEKFARGILVALFIPAVILATKAVVALTLALLANPFTALLVAVTATAGVLAAFSDEIKVTEDGVTNLADLSAAAFDFIKQGANSLLDLIESGLNFIQDKAQETLGESEATVESVLASIARGVDQTIGFFRGLYNVGSFVLGLFLNLVRDQINAVVDLLESLFNSIVLGLKITLDAAVLLLNGFIRGANAVLSVTSGARIPLLEALGIDTVSLDRAAKIVLPVVEQFGKAIGDEFERGFNITPASDAIEALFTKAEQKAQERLKRQEEEIKQQQRFQEILNQPREIPDITGELRDNPFVQSFLRDIEQEILLLSLLGEERKVQAELFEIENKLKRQGVALNAEQLAFFKSELERLPVLREQAAILDSILGPTEDLRIGQQALNNLFDDGNISIQEYNDKLRDLQIKALDAANTLESGLQSGLLSIGDEISSVGELTKNTLVDGFRNAEEALIEFTQIGQVNFSEFARSLLSDLTRLTIRLSLFNALTGTSLGGFLGINAPTPNALGNVFSNGSITPFANGSVINTPTTFPMRNGIGLLGEAGPEAIMPLSRNSRGELGVQVSGQDSQPRSVTNVQIQVTTRDAQSFNLNARQIERRFRGAR